MATPPALDRLPHPVALLDGQGRTLAVNAAWRSCQALSALAVTTPPGGDYLAAYRRSSPELAAELERLLAGAIDELSVEYSVAGPDRESWWLARAHAVAVDGRRGALLQHHDVTERRAAEEVEHFESELGRALVMPGVGTEPAALVAAIARAAGWRMAALFSEEADGQLTCVSLIVDGIPAAPRRRISRPAALLGAIGRARARPATSLAPLGQEERALLESLGVATDGASACAALLIGDSHGGPDGVAAFLLDGHRPSPRLLASLDRVLAPSRGATRAQPSVESLIALAAGSSSPVLLLGESGVGKTHLARQIHDASNRRDGVFLDLNCAGLPPTLVESELFGYERGAFTGAIGRKRGLLEEATGGTVLLDEVGELDPLVQSKLLKVLETRKFRRLGGTAEISVDVRFITATNRDLKVEYAAGRFRLDLYYRISVIELSLAPLRARLVELPELARRLLSQIGQRSDRALKLSADAAALLGQYRWPGNIREMQNVLERAALGVDEWITAEHVHAALPVELASAAPPPRRNLADFERSHIEKTLLSTGFNVRRAAQLLGISRTTLYQRMRRYGIDVADSRTGYLRGA